MNGYQTIAILVAIIMAASLGVIVYTTTSNGGGKAFPTKGTITFTNGELAFDGLQSRSTLTVQGSKYVYYEDGLAGTTTTVRYSGMPSSMLPDGAKESDFQYYMGKETEPSTAYAAVNSGVKGTLVSSKDGVEVYSYVVGTHAMTISFKGDKITAFQSGADSVDVITFSPDVSGSLKFSAADEAAAVANNAVMKAAMTKAVADKKAARELMTKEERELSTCNYWDALNAFIDSQGQYGNWCGKGQNWLCTGKDYSASVYLPGVGNRNLKVCSDTGFDKTCAKHDHGAYSEDALMGLATANYCEVDGNFYYDRQNKNSKTFKDNKGYSEYSGNTGAACLFRWMPCLRYEKHSHLSWCGWSGFCYKDHWGFTSYNGPHSNYAGYMGNCKSGKCYKGSYH